MQGSILDDVGALVNRYFAWMASGSPVRYIIGIGGPVVVVVLVYVLAFGSGGDDPEVLQVVATTPTPPAVAASVSITARPAGSSVAVRNSTTPGTSAAGTSTVLATTTPGTPRPTVAPGGIYVVKSGDTLGAICSANVPSMTVSACVDNIVQLNKLANAASLQIDQQLILPGGSMTPSTGGSTPAVASTATRPAATATRIP